MKQIHPLKIFVPVAFLLAAVLRAIGSYIAQEITLVDGGIIAMFLLASMSYTFMLWKQYRHMKS